MSNETPEHLVSLLVWLRAMPVASRVPWSVLDCLEMTGGYNVHFGFEEVDESLEPFAHDVGKPGCSCEGKATN